MQFKSTVSVGSVYLHWPFCPYRCHFCPFVALAGQDEFMESYHEALKKEILLYQENTICKKQILKTVFLGGGTPSTYPTHLLLDTFDILKKVFNFDRDIEITIEVNPGTVSEEKVKAWKSAGINRISIGVQSLKDKSLHSLNRIQSKQDVCQLMNFLPEYIENISVDLIMGLPNVSFAEWKKDLAEIVTWKIKHISVYFLTIHEDTRLFFNIKQGKVTIPSDNYMVETYNWTQKFLHNHGFEQYELSNFARLGYYSRHNSVYWDRKPYKGFGLGACSFDGTLRIQNEINLQKYIESSGKKDSAMTYEYLTEEQIRLEKVLLGLRRITGVLFQDIAYGLSAEKKDLLQNQINNFEQEGLLFFDGSVVRLTQQGLILENQIISRLIV